MSNIKWKSCPICGTKILSSYKMCFSCMDKVRKVTLEDLDKDIRRVSSKVDEMIDTLNEVINKVNELEGKVVNENTNVSRSGTEDSNLTKEVRRKHKKNDTDNGDA